MADRPTGVHAVLWRAREAPADLLRALSQQGITWEEASGPFDAFSRVLAARHTVGRSRVLLLVEPESLAGADEIRAALERFEPATACWAYRVGASPRLAPIAPRAKAPEPQIVVKPRPGPTARAGLRLAHDPGHEESAGRRNKASDQNPNDCRQPALQGDDEPQSPRSLLTPEELAMLLADDPD